jgi:hypothetical protein
MMIMMSSNLMDVLGGSVGTCGGLEKLKEG